MQSLKQLGNIVELTQNILLYNFNLFQITTSALPTLTVVMLMLFVKMYHDLTLVHVRQDFQEMETVAVVSSSPTLGVAESCVSLKQTNKQINKQKKKHFRMCNKLCVTN